METQQLSRIEPSRKFIRPAPTAPQKNYNATRIRKIYDFSAAKCFRLWLPAYSPEVKNNIARKD